MLVLFEAWRWEIPMTVWMLFFSSREWICRGGKVFNVTFRWCSGVPSGLRLR